MFFAGQRPAVNVGLSVSRVGGDAQTKAMKKASGSLRIDLAQYREMEVFTQFSSELDSNTKELLQHGKILMELLKQPLSKPLSLHQQVITLIAANNKLLLDIDPKEVKAYVNDMLNYFEAKHADIVEKIDTEKVLTDELIQQIIDAVKAFKK